MEHYGDHTLKILEKIAIAAIVALTVLLPLKFASLIGIPEATALFPEGLFPWLIVLWPASAFPAFSAAVLIIALIAFRPHPDKQFKAFVIAGLWLLLALVGYIGAVNAETYDFVAMQIRHGLGIGATRLGLPDCCRTARMAAENSCLSCSQPRAGGIAGVGTATGVSRTRAISPSSRNNPPHRSLRGPESPHL